MTILVVWWRLESLTGIVKFLMRVHFVISCGVTRKKLILGPSVHVALGGFLVRGWHRRYTTMLFVVRVIYCIICIICCCLHEFCYILWLFLVQSHKQPRSCVSSTPACARGFEIHVSRQGPCDSEFVNLHYIFIPCLLAFYHGKYQLLSWSVQVWSAPNYCYRCGNVASILSFNEKMVSSYKPWNYKFLLFIIYYTFEF